MLLVAGGAAGCSGAAEMRQGVAVAIGPIPRSFAWKKKWVTSTHYVPRLDVSGDGLVWVLSRKTQFAFLLAFAVSTVCTAYCDAIVEVLLEKMLLSLRIKLGSRSVPFVCFLDGTTQKASSSVRSTAVVSLFCLVLLTALNFLPTVFFGLFFSGLLLL